MKGMFFNGQYMKLFNSYFYYHLNLDFVLDGNVSQKNKNKWRTFKKKKNDQNYPCSVTSYTMTEDFFQLYLNYVTPKWRV